MKIIDITNKIPQSNYTIGRDGYKIDCIITHITGDSKAGQCLSWFMNPSAKVSAHYVIEKNGNIYMCVNPQNRAYHAGIVNKPSAGIYFDKGNVNPNRYSIGIECVSAGEPLEASQWESLVWLVKYLCETYNIPLTRYNITGHYQFDSVDRPFDPIKSYSVDELVKEVNRMPADWMKKIIQECLDLGLITDPKWLNNCEERASIWFVSAMILNLYKKLKK